MISELKFSTETFFTGRNGTFKAIGLKIWYEENVDVFTISPITSKGKIGRCSIDIPKDDVINLITKLQSVK